jgi:predicted metal-dependent peptidase
VSESVALYGHRGTRAIQRMVEFAPSSGGLALWVKHQDLAEDAKKPPALTDGSTVFYFPKFEKLPLAEQTGLVAHEVLHIALRHPQRFLDLRQLIGDADLELYNVCADAIVNSALSHLSWLTLPSSAVYLDRLLVSALGIRQSVEASLLEWDVERLYRAIDDRRKEGLRSGGAREGGPRKDGQRAARVRAMSVDSNADLLPTPGANARPEAQAEEAREWSERVMRAHAGDGEYSMLRALMADLPTTRTPWEQLLRRQLARALAPKLDLSWSRPTRSYIANQGRGGEHRRLPWEPGFSQSKSVPRLAVIVDVSGSIDDDLMQRFAREIDAIVRRLETALSLIVGDDQVRRVEHFKPGFSNLKEMRFSGGGGTDFTPLLTEADKHRPDITVVLTDLAGPANFRPRWPVIWAVPESYASAVQPFGRKLVLR